MLPTEHSLVVPSISRDMRALYDAHFAFVWRYLAHRGVPVQALDDLVQDVFRIVREHPSRHDSARPRNVVVCMIARQALREFNKRHAAMAQRGGGEWDGDAPTEIFSRSAAAKLLDAAIADLSELQREVILLCEGERMAPRDVGDALGIPETTVKRRLESATKLMNAFVAKLKTQPVWESSLGAAMRDARSLIEAATVVRTPADRDRERVFASMLAASMTGGAGLPAIDRSAAKAAQPIELPRPRTPSRPVDANLSSPSLAPVEVTNPAPRIERSTYLWGAGSMLAVAIAIASYAAASSGRSAARDAAEMTKSPATVLDPVQARGPAPRVEALPTPAAEAAPTQAEAPSAEPKTNKPAREPSRKSSPARRAKSHRHGSDAPQESGDREAKQLFAAQHAFKLGDSRAALDMLNEQDRKYPDSAFSTERAALRAQILCESGRTKAARRVILELEAKNAAAPVLASVDQACMSR